MSSQAPIEIGNWDDEDEEDIIASLKLNPNYESLNDVIEFSEEAPFPTALGSASTAGTSDKPLPELSPGTSDLTGDRGLLLSMENTNSLTVSSTMSAHSPIKPSIEHPFVEFHYEGFLASSGEKFDSSRDQNYPLVVRLDLPPSGKSTLIQGLEIGLRHIPIGVTAKLEVSAQYGYSEKGAQDIPPNSDLVFNIEVLDVRATHRRLEEEEDFTEKDLSRLESVRKQREVAQQRREEEVRAREEEKQRKAQRAADLQEKLAKKKQQPKKRGKKK